MNKSKNIVVAPSFPEIGVLSKEDRGMIAETAELPDNLKALKAKIGRIGAKLGIDINATKAEIAAQFDARSKKVVQFNVSNDRATGLDM